MLKSFGDRIPPYITPTLINSSCYFTSIAVYAYNHLIVLTSSSEYPFFFNSLNNKLWGTESNAFYMSKCIVAMILPLNLLEFFQNCNFYYSFKRFSSQPRPLEKPIWFLLFFITFPPYSSYSIL